MSNTRPLIVQYNQNDASVETENYLRNKRYLIGRLHTLQATTRRLYQDIERDGRDLSCRISMLHERVNTSLN